MFKLGRQFLVSYFPAAVPPRSAAFFIFSLLSVSGLVVGGWPDASHATQFSGIALNTFCGFVALTLVLFTPSSRHLPLISIFAVAIFLRLVSCFAQPLLEDDFYRYLWDGLQTFTIGSPYIKAPLEFFPGNDLSQAWQDVLSGINNPDLKTIYGPTLQYLFLLSYLFAPAELWPIQLFLSVIDIGILIALSRANVAKPFLLAYAVHPLILQEAIASAHPDILLGGLIVCCVLAWRAHKPLLTGLLLAVACSTKISAALLIPFFLIPKIDWECRVDNLKSQCITTARWSWRVIVAGIVGLLVLYFPLISLAHSELESLLIFGQAWRFNPLYFRVFEFLLYQSASDQLIRIICGLLLVSLCIVLLWRQWSRPDHQLFPPILPALIALLLLSPIVNPWYWLWLLPVAVLLQRKYLILCCSLAPLSYWNSNTLLETGWLTQFTTDASFVVPWVVTIIQVVIFSVVFFQEWSHAMNANRRSDYHPMNLFC